MTQAKINLKDLTFTIPVRYDTDDRIRNLIALLNYLTHWFDTNIIVWEEDNAPKFHTFLQSYPNVKYVFKQAENDIFFRTRILNDMARMADTPYIANYDCDCILYPQQYVDAVNQLRNNTSDICTAFTSFTFDVPKQFHSRIIQERSVFWLHPNQCVCVNSTAVAMGGCVFWNKAKFIEAGMENENFVSWGPEDQERVHRALKLGMRYTRAQGILFHLQHDRLQNSGDGHRFITQNNKEFEKIKQMDSAQLRSYIATWPWVSRK